MLTSTKEECKTEKFSVFLMTDDEKIVPEAKRDFGSRLLFVDDSFSRNSNHPGKRNSTATEKMENFFTMMLNIHYCLKCDSFVSQRRSNIARLIDELKMTKAAKLTAPFIEVGEYDFDWK